jgi:hypothetical protein
VESTLARNDFYPAILTGKTCSADDDHLGQKDRMLKLHLEHDSLEQQWCT